jgi:anti-sigma factor RsiW
MNKIMHPIEPEELMAYVDGELTADRAAAAAAHLGECVECQGLVAELRSVSQHLKT